MSNTVEIARHYSAEIHNDRDIWDAFKSAVRELRELRTEIRNGNTGVDGIKGEAIDVLNSVLDVLFKAHPEITIEEIDAIMEAKCRKWMLKYANEEDQPSTDEMQEAGEIMAEFEAAGVPVEVIAKIANIGPNSVYCIIDGSLAARRTTVRLNLITPLIKKAFHGEYRAMGPFWDKAGPDGVTLRDLISAPVLDLTKLATCLDAFGEQRQRQLASGLVPRS
jgi:hypothetical protein